MPFHGPARTSRNHRLAAFITEADLSYAALATRIRTIAAENGECVRTNSAAIAHWVRGTHPKATTTAYLAEALSRRTQRPITPADLGLGSPEDAPTTTGNAVADLAHLGRMDVDRRGFLTAVFSLPAAMAVPASAPLSTRADAARHGGTIGQAEVETVCDIVTTFARSDGRLGGVGRSTIAEYLATDATAYLSGRFSSGTMRAEMFEAVAALAQLCGWKAHDAGREGLAQRYYAHAWQLAHESGSRGHSAFILRMMAHQAIDMGHGTHCVDLAGAGLISGRGHLDAATKGQLHLAVARTRAARGDARAARAALKEAEQCINTHPADGERPWWAANSGSIDALLSSHTAKALRALGDTAAEKHMWESCAAGIPAPTRAYVH